MEAASSGRFATAEKLFVELTETHKYNPDLLCELASLRRHMQKNREAAEDYFKAGEMFMRAGMGANALSALRECLEIHPNHGAAKRLRSILLEKAMRKFDRDYQF